VFSLQSDSEPIVLTIQKIVSCFPSRPTLPFFHPRTPFTSFAFPTIALSSQSCTDPSSSLLLFVASCFPQPLRHAKCDAHETTHPIAQAHSCAETPALIHLSAYRCHQMCLPDQDHHHSTTRCLFTLFETKMPMCQLAMCFCMFSPHAQSAL